MLRHRLHRLLTEEKWENFDAEGLFSPPSKSVHTNKLIRTDEFTAGTKENIGELPNHLDELYEIEGDVDNNQEIEIKADKIIDERESKEEEENAEEEPIQKEKEGVEEVVEATTKTSEDVHGGDEATKDIEDSPNPADNGLNNNKKSLNKTNLLDKEDWERKANSSGRRLVLDSLNEIKRESNKEPQGMGHGYFFGENEALRPQMEIVFKKGRELLEKFANDEDVSQKIAGIQKWDAKEVVLCSVKLQHQKISDAKYEYQKEADIVVYLDISGSCYEQSEMFAAIGSSVIGPSVAVYVGYNGYVRKKPLTPPKKRLSNYSQAFAWVKEELEKIEGWDRKWEIGEWDFVEFIKLHSPKTAIIFGDFDGLKMYEEAVKVAKKCKFYWFANVAPWVDTPKGFNNKNFFKEVFEPKDFLKVLRRLR